MTEYWLESKASGTPRKDVWEDLDLTNFSPGDPVWFDPFPHDPVEGVHATFVEYYRDDERVAVIDVPEGDHQWFNEPAGTYCVSAKYLIPQ